MAVPVAVCIPDHLCHHALNGGQLRHDLCGDRLAGQYGHRIGVGGRDKPHSLSGVQAVWWLLVVFAFFFLRFSGDTGCLVRGDCVIPAAEASGKHLEATGDPSLTVAVIDEREGTDASRVSASGYRFPLPASLPAVRWPVCRGYPATARCCRTSAP